MMFAASAAFPDLLNDRTAKYRVDLAAVPGLAAEANVKVPDTTHAACLKSTGSSMIRSLTRTFKTRHIFARVVRLGEVSPRTVRQTVACGKPAASARLREFQRCCFISSFSFLTLSITTIGVNFPRMRDSTLFHLCKSTIIVVIIMHFVVMHVRIIGNRYA